jgi:predicted nucleotide-binding protein
MGEMNMPNTRNVFVIHGRNRAARNAMFDFLRAVGLNPLEWGQAVKKTGKGSPYIGEVLDTAFSNAQAVVVVLTGDDLARLREEFVEDNDEDYERNLTQQARPNVLFEAGMAFGRHAERTIMVQLGTLRPFSDIAGKHAIHFRDSPEQRTELRERLKTAGCAFAEGGTDWLKAGNFDEALRLATGVPPGTKRV